MHQNAIVATCLLNNQLVFSDEFDRKDPILGFRQNSTEGRDPQTIARPPVHEPGRESCLRAFYGSRIRKPLGFQ